jgi:molybdopterin converting factor small subunit
MIKCSVEFFGLPNEITDQKKVEIELNNGTGIRDALAALRRKIPALEGNVIKAGEDHLTEYYVFNIKGQFHYDDSDIQLQDGDKLLLLLLATGG